MKKTYINPNIKVVMINTSNHMLSGSENMGYKGDYNSETITMGSRRNTIWDEDDEE